MHKIHRDYLPKISDVNGSRRSDPRGADILLLRFTVRISAAADNLLRILIGPMGQVFMIACHSAVEYSEKTKVIKAARPGLY
jgi:hypothetical protein